MPNQKYGPELNLNSSLDFSLYSNPALNAEIDSRGISGSNLKSYSEQLDSWLNPELNTGPNTRLNLRAMTGSNLESHSELKSGPSLKSAEGLSPRGHMGLNLALNLGLNLEPASGSISQPNLGPNQETNLEPLLKCKSGIGSEIGFECGDGPQLRALAGVERLYSRGAWSEALQAGEALQAQLRLGATNPLRLRLELLIGHTLLYGLGKRSAAESHYQKVQTHSGDPVLLAIAAQGLQRCGGLGADPPAEPQHSADAPPSCTSLRSERIELVGSAFPPQAALANAPGIGIGTDTGTGADTGEEPGAATILSVAVASISPAPAAGLELLGPAAIAPASDPGSHAKPWLKQSSGEDLAAVNYESANTGAKNIAVVSNTLASNTLTDNALAGNGLANNALTNKALTNKVLTNNAVTNNAVASNALASNAVANSAVADMEIAGNTFAGTAIANSALASDGGAGEPSPMPWQGWRIANQPSSPGGPAAPLSPWRSKPGSEQLSAPRAAMGRAATERAAMCGAAMYGPSPGKDPGDGPVAGPAPEVNAAEMAELAKGLLLLVLD
jgi:hypothetical protein